MLNFTEHITDLTGLASIASAIAATLLLVPGIAKLRKARLAIVLGAVFLLALLPLGEISLAAYVRGATGDLSITTQVLLWGALLTPWCHCSTRDHRSRQALLLPVALISLALYPLALGVSLFDPYRLGYGEPLFIFALLLIALASWLRKSPLITLCVSLSALAWSIGWYESANLWDYLLDPFLAIYALGALTLNTGKQLLHGRR